MTSVWCRAAYDVLRSLKACYSPFLFPIPSSGLILPACICALCTIKGKKRPLSNYGPGNPDLGRGNFGDIDLTFAAFVFVHSGLSVCHCCVSCNIVLFAHANKSCMTNYAIFLSEGIWRWWGWGPRWWRRGGWGWQLISYSFFHFGFHHLAEASARQSL